MYMERQTGIKEKEIKNFNCLTYDVNDTINEQMDVPWLEIVSQRNSIQFKVKNVFLVVLYFS